MVYGHFYQNLVFSIFEFLNHFNYFVTSNFYIGLEINAQELLNIISQLRDSNLDHLFLSNVLGSQSCECTFRSGMACTMVNFSTHDIIHIDLIELRYSTDYQVNYLIVMSSSGINTSKMFHSKLPSNSEISETVEMAITSQCQAYGVEVEDHWIINPNFDYIQ